MTDATTRTPAALCWHCDRMLDGATGFGPTENERPGPGAVALCLYCGAVALFDADLELRPPTEGELERLGANKEELRVAFARFSWARQHVMIKESLMRPEGGEADR